MYMYYLVFYSIFLFVVHPGTMSHDLPKWQPPEDGSVSSLGSPDNDIPSSSHLSHKKNLSGKV